MHILHCHELKNTFIFLANLAGKICDDNNLEFVVKETCS